MSISIRMAAALVAGAALAGSCSDGGDDGMEPEPTGSIQATVTADGSPAAAVTVQVFAPGGSTALTSGNTSATGAVTLGSLEPGGYDVEVVVPGGFELASGETARKSVTVVAEQTANVSFGLEEIVVAPTEGQVRARVLADGSGLADVQVDLHPVPATGTPLATLSTAADGRALFPSLDPGSYEVEITVPDGYSLEAGETDRKEASVTAGATTDVTFQLQNDNPGVIEVIATGTTFTPSSVTISPGTTVRWVAEGGSHTVTPDGHSEWTAAPLPVGATFEHTFDETGRFEYFCEPHVSLGMTGTVVVQ